MACVTWLTPLRGPSIEGAFVRRHKFKSLILGIPCYVHTPSMNFIGGGVV